MRLCTSPRAVAGGLIAAIVIAVALVSGVPSASAAATIPTVRVVSVSSSSFTVTVPAVRGTGWRYRLYASAHRPDVYYANLPRTRAYSSARSASPTLTVRLPHRAGVYWYRVQATRGASTRTSDILSIGLRPGRPTGLRVRAARGGTPYLTWSSRAVGGFRVQQATNAKFTTGVRSYSLLGNGSQLTPYGLIRGTTYWFRVRAENKSTPSSYTAAVSVRARGTARAVRVMTYNVLTLGADGTRPAAGSERVARWSQRRPKVAQAILSERPDVVAVQEASGWVGAPRGKRQVDDLVRALGGRYRLAKTETPPNQPYYFRTGNYLLYKTSTIAPAGRGWWWNVGAMPQGGSRYAAYQPFRHVSGGSTFLAVSPHLYTPGGLTGDRLRRSQTTTMIKRASAYAAAHGGLPVVYAGDFNSHARHHLDGPEVAMRAAGAANTLFVAQQRRNVAFNSANRYQRTPPAYGLNVDHIYTSPGVGVAAWRQVLLLSRGRFVGAIPSDHNPVVADLLIPR